MNGVNSKNIKEKDLFLNTNPRSHFSEAIKLVKTNLAFSSIDKDIKKILITSPEASDGKSFISSNLALAYAMEGKNVLIIDCDMRKGRLNKIFKVPNKSKLGYSNLILNYRHHDNKDNTEFNIGEYILPTKTKNLYIIPSGPTPPNPVELLSSENNSKLIKKLERFFDIIILDCPPVVGLSDSLIQTKNSDYNILVLSSGKTKEESLKTTIKLFEQANSKINGVILNKIRNKGVKNLYYYYKSSYGDYY